MDQNDVSPLRAILMRANVAASRVNHGDVRAALNDAHAWIEAHPDMELTDDVRREQNKLTAQLDALVCMSNANVPTDVQAAVLTTGPDNHPDYWRKVRSDLYPEIFAKEYVTDADEEHLIAYTQLVIARMIADDAPPTDRRKLLRGALDMASNAFFSNHLYPKRSADYAGGATDLVARVIRGAETLHLLSEQQRDYWRGDLEMFRSAAARHEYAEADVRRAVAALERADLNAHLFLAEMRAEVERLKRLEKYYRTRGPAHLEALEQQWRAYRLNAAVQRTAESSGLPHSGALTRATLDNLRAATAYCWSPMPVEAVASAGRTIPNEATFSPETLGDLAAPGAAGWWWFEEPVPIRTLIASAEDAPVVALLWRHEVHPDGRARTFFTAFVGDSTVAGDVSLFARKALGADAGVFPTPSASWLINHDTPVGELEATLRAGYNALHPTERGDRAAGIDVTVAAALWFTRFFLSAAVWLRQRIAVTHRGQGIRQTSRRLARENKLTEPPTVEIVQLRRNEVSMERATGPATARDWSCRWIVHGFYRNQYYPSTGKHALKYIDSYIKGPSDKPLKTAARVYAVTR